MRRAGLGLLLLLAGDLHGSASSTTSTTSTASVAALSRPGILGDRDRHADPAYRAAVERYHTAVEARSARLFATAARARKLMDRQSRNGPMPAKAYVYGDKEKTWENTQALIDWAEGRPHTREARKLARDKERGMLHDRSGKSAPSLLEQGQGHPGGSLLRRWRMRMQDKVDAQEEKRRADASLEDSVARVQDAMGSLPLSEAHRTADVIAQRARDEEGSASGALSAFIATRTVARKLKSVAQGMVAREKSEKDALVADTSSSFLESGEHVHTHARARAKAKAKGLQALQAGSDQTCIMCLYFMEKLEQKIGFPSHDLHNDGEANVQDGGQSSYPGPAQYEGGISPMASLTNAIPGPGYSSGGFVQIAESSKGASAAHAQSAASAGVPSLHTDSVGSVASALVSPGDFAADYATLIPPNTNLAKRLDASYNNEPREHAEYAKANERQASMEDKLKKLGMEGVEFLDTGHLQAGQVGAGTPVGRVARGGGARRREHPRQPPMQK